MFINHVYKSYLQIMFISNIYRSHLQIKFINPICSGQQAQLWGAQL